jgi:hypothetical protein
MELKETMKNLQDKDWNLLPHEYVVVDLTTKVNVKLSLCLTN